VKRIVSALNLAGVLMVHSVVLIIPTGQMLETATTDCCLCFGLLIQNNHMNVGFICQAKKASGSGLQYCNFCVYREVMKVLRQFEK
jgi:hypothetical protein